MVYHYSLWWVSSHVLPQAFASEVASRLTASNGGLMLILIEVILWFVIILLCIFLYQSSTTNTVQYARRTADGGLVLPVEKKLSLEHANIIPLKLNAAGVYAYHLLRKH